jgi:copper(I)-binding protein
MRRLLKTFALAGALALTVPAVAALAQTPAPQVKAGDLVIEGPWARATPGGAKVAGGYVKITNTGKQADKLVGGSIPAAGVVEVHEMATVNNVMQMRRLDGLEIKPGETVELKPGSYHLMFMQLKDGLTAGQTIKGTMVFEKAGTVNVEFFVAPIGAATRDAKSPAKAGGHSHH